MQPLNQTQKITEQQVSQPAAHIVIGQIKEIINDQVIVSYDRNLLPRSQPALATVAISAADITRQVALMFTEQGQPIVMGFLTPVSSATSRTVEQSNQMAFDIIQDGEHCQIQASKSITLQCGDSCITLNNQGEIAINGENITSKARKKNNILGGTINLN
ncbi:conserved hypothetical protein [Oleispira antarctica RB-8]|uniref:DUF6484 domain-containing protein n=1 Tax=Oleispira antarctica RB-8 TaxID=698738 RepID=R4YP25_OLEAN|nr:conserved hypothetical protein [Oleispira antarctica RB-8]